MDRLPRGRPPAHCQAAAGGAPAASFAPDWRIFDARYAAENRLATWIGRRDAGWFRKARTLDALACQIDLDPAALGATVERFNRFARDCKDENFNRGETAWEMFYTRDPSRPSQNGALGTLEVPPFYAAPYHRSILGTNGGPRTSERGEVVRADGSVIAGLYCAGIAMANPIDTKAVGAGTTIGPCLTWCYICGQNVLRENARDGCPHHARDGGASPRMARARGQHAHKEHGARRPIS